MLEQIQAVILDSQSSVESRLSNEDLFDFFVQNWEQTWQELNINSNDFRDDYFRFDTKVGLLLNGEIIAFHGYSSFNLADKSHREHSYFRKINTPIARMLLDEGLKNIATTEYMIVAPNYRKIANQYIAEILGAFTTQYFKTQTCDAMITIARNNRGVNQMCKMFGAYCLKEKENLHNVEVDIMVFKPQEIVESPNPVIANTVNRLINQVVTRNEKIKEAA